MASSGVLGNFGVSPMLHIVEVRVMNSENFTNYFLHLRLDRLVHFYDFVMRNRKPNPQPIPGPGISAPAATGLNAIFTTIPQKFPLSDILVWLRDKQKHISAVFQVRRFPLQRLKTRWRGSAKRCPCYAGTEVR